jgi:hypothetical protein
LSDNGWLYRQALTNKGQKHIVVRRITRKPDESAVGLKTHPAGKAANAVLKLNRSRRPDPQPSAALSRENLNNVTPSGVC